MTTRTDKQRWLLFLGLMLLAPAGHAACTNAISPTNRTHGPGANTNTISITASNTCSWTVTNTNNWISLISGASGTGDGTLTYAVAANPNPAWRTGLLAVAGQTLTIAQNPVVCEFNVSPTNRTHGYSGGGNLISVTTSAGCSWTAVNTSSWINISSGSSGTGNGSIIYSVPANPSGLARSGVVVIGDQTTTINQLGAPCSYFLSTNKQSHGFGAVTGMVNVTATPDCPWSVATTNNWIAILTASNGTGSGAVSYALDVNAGLARTGLVMIADKLLTVTQQGLGCTFKLSPTNRPHGYAAASNAVTLTTSNGCPWQIINTNSWISFPAGNSGTGSNVISYLVEENASPDPRVGVVLIDGQTFTVTQSGVVCDYSVSPSTRNHGHGAASNFIHVSTSAGCPWTVDNTNTWVNILTGSAGGMSGTGDADVGYTVPANPNSYSRTGSVVIAGQVFTVSQNAAPCSYAITPEGAVHGFNSEPGLVSVIAVGGCPWTVTNTNAWITITPPLNGTGNGTVAYTVSANAAGGGPRSGNFVIAGSVFSVTQAGNTCSYRLSPVSRNHGNGATSNYFTVNAGLGCAWTVVNPNAWLTIASGASGVSTGAVGYTVTANPTGLARTSLVTVADQILTISQNPAPCTYSLLPASASLGAGAATGVVNVTSLAGCAWAVTNTIPWVGILSGSNGIGSSAVTYTVSANPDTNARSGSFTINGQTFNLTQAGVPVDCSFRLSPTNRAHGFAATTNSVTVLTADGCAWATENTNNWITVLSGVNGVNEGMVNYAIDANTSGIERVGMLMISGQPFTITQRIVSCSFSLSPTSRSHNSGGTTNSFNVNVASTCSWSAASAQNWITILSGGPAGGGGAGNGTVTYSVAPNFNLSPRTGEIVVDGQTFTVTQDAFVCSFRLSPTNRTHGFAATTNSVNVITTTNCSWTATATEPWITILSGGPAGGGGAGNGTITYSVTGNLSPLQRTGVVMVADQALTLIQRAATNGFSFEAITLQEGGSVRLRLVGAPAGVWRVQGSTNLLDWIDMASVTNVTGAVEHLDTGYTSRPRRFYRAVLQ